MNSFLRMLSRSKKLPTCWWNLVRFEILTCSFFCSQFTAFTAIRTSFLQCFLRLLFLVNLAVNFCQICNSWRWFFSTAFNAILTSFQRIHRNPHIFCDFWRSHLAPGTRDRYILQNLIHPTPRRSCLAITTIRLYLDFN